MVRTKPPEDDGEVTTFAGSNVTDETKRGYYKKALKAKQEAEKAAEIYKAANAEYRLVLKAAKGAGVSSEAIAYALSVRHLDNDALREAERDKARMLALSGIWPTIQEDFFNLLIPSPDLHNETTVDMAYDAGHQCGIKGENRSINPYIPATEKWDAWDRGWLTGQGGNVEKLTPNGRTKRMTKKEQAEAFAQAEVHHEPSDMPAEDPEAGNPLFE
jgi:hypothetical protein